MAYHDGMTEYKSFFKTVGSGEGDRCHYPTRLDPYGCGCQHNCSYCYAKSLLQFRKLWNPAEPACADIVKIRRTIQRLPDGLPPIRLGGMTDPFMPLEDEKRLTYRTIEALQEKGQPYLIVTKSATVADPDYTDLMDRRLAHIQITVTSTDDELAKTYEHASPPSERLEALDLLYSMGFDTQLRLSPYMREYIDLDRISKVSCDTVIVEFLRVNSWIKKWFKIDYSKYTKESGGYKHLPLPEKIEQIEELKQALGDTPISVCEDEPVAYDYWKTCFNPNPDDCCNLRL